MRITAGEYRSRLIRSPRGVPIRPTADRVKQALFNILGKVIIDRSVLDLFGGTGNLGLEAISRGAASCVFIDNNVRCIDAIKYNVESLKLPQSVKTEVILQDAFWYIREVAKKGLQFGLIFLDPPYHKELIKKSLILLDNYNIITPSSYVIAEHYRKDDLPADEELKNLELCRQEKYGSTILSFYRTRRKSEA
ncbi:MAG: 16S rRNA (guanine(966)-N(2))-methyltransferase RsmD [Candidatus Omnitrophica bacterium]|nr:16S rRNA (guanine(966)-N(2))-methyltransferase RsmD [Candidatus Omnitrophota bacterium]